MVADFSNDPAPLTDEVNVAQEGVFEDSEGFISTLGEVVSICDSDFAGISEAEYDTYKEGM